MVAEACAAGADHWLLGGDYSAFGPWPRETLELLRELENAEWLRGNGERWLVDEPNRSGVHEPLEAARRELSAADVQWLAALPTHVILGSVLFVHASPLSDVESFAAEPREGEERLLDGVHGRAVVFGHSHLQFRRSGPNGTDLINPGSVGVPLDGDVRAAWALRSGNDVWEFRRTEYDVERAAAKARELGSWGELIARRLERGSD